MSGASSAAGPVLLDGRGRGASDLVRKCARDEKLLVLFVDDEEEPDLLLRKLKLSTSDARVFIAKEPGAAYEILLAEPSLVDAVLVDWRLDTWPALERESAAMLGIPDRTPGGGLFSKAFSSPMPAAGSPDRVTDEAHLGGHAQLLLALGSSAGAACLAMSKYITTEGTEPFVLRARGAVHFIDKNVVSLGAGEEDLREARHLLLAIGGVKRDARLWQSLYPKEVSDVLTHLRRSSPEDIARCLREFEGMEAPARHRSALQSRSSTAARTQYLVGSLSGLDQPRIFCASQLLDHGLSRIVARRRADRELKKAHLLQPSLRPLGRDTLAGVVDRVAAAHKCHRLRAGEDYLHVFVSPGVGRIDYYCSYRTAASRGRRFVLEHLGTTLQPRLAAALDDSGVWPAPKLSRIRHLLKGDRSKRIFHLGRSIVRSAARVFGPSIDSLLLGDLLLRLSQGPGSPLYRVQAVAEVGTGTGFLLSVIVAHWAARLRAACGSDVNTAAVECIKSNIEANWSIAMRRGKASIVIGTDLLSLVAPESVDLIVCNPPYLPPPKTRRGRTHAEADVAIAGTKVIRGLLAGSGHRAISPDGILLLVTSTLSIPTVKAAVDEAARKGVTWHTKRVRELSWVPLDLPEVQGSPEWLDELLALEAEGVFFDTSSTFYPLRHSIVVSAFSKSAERIEELTAFSGDALSPGRPRRSREPARGRRRC